MGLIFNEKVVYVYCDASFQLEYKKGLIAFIVCDSNDNILYKKNRIVECETSMQAEFMAIQSAVRWLNFYQKSNLLRNRIYINIISDAQSLVRHINDPLKVKCNCTDKSNLLNLNEQMNYLRDNNNVTVKFRDRKNNKLAHNHTKASCLYAMV